MREMQLEARVENLGLVNGLLDEELDRLDCPPRTRMQLEIALEELFVNIASYAYAPGVGSADVRMDYDAQEGIFRITLADSGKPFDPVSAEDPDITLPAEERSIGGLGVFMVRKSMDLFTYERMDGKNIVTIGKKI